MFEQTLVESSDERAPVLNAVLWTISAACGVAGFLLWYFLISLILGRPMSNVQLSIQSLLYGAVPLFLTALMLCYVYADSRKLRFSTTLWMLITFVFNFAGFLVYLVYSANKTKNWKRATMPMAYILDGVAVGVMVLVPLIYTQGLPKAQLLTMLEAPPPPPPPPPPPAAAPPRVVVHQVSLKQLMEAPTVIPKNIAKVKDQPISNASAGVVGGVPGGVPGGSMGGVIGGVIGGMGVAPPPPPPKAKTPSVIRVGGQVEAAKVIYQPMPQYPPLAKMARIQGTVRLEAVIAQDGTIQDLKVLSGHPLLIPAALSAVKTWRYEPTLLNGVPVKVITEIDVNFTLSD